MDWSLKNKVMLSRLCFSAILSTIAYKIDYEHIRDYKNLFSACKVEILQFTVNKIKVLSSFMLISDEFWLKVPKIAIKGTLVSC